MYMITNGDEYSNLSTDYYLMHMTITGDKYSNLSTTFYFNVATLLPLVLMISTQI